MDCTCSSLQNIFHMMRPFSAKKYVWLKAVISHTHTRTQTKELEKIKSKLNLGHVERMPKDTKVDSLKTEQQTIEIIYSPRPHTKTWSGNSHWQNILILLI